MNRSVYDLRTAEIALMPGMRMAEFQLVRQIGLGADSEVWLAQNVYGWQVAIKLLSRHTDLMLPERRYGYRMMLEGHQMTLMHHPHILPVYRASFDHQWYWVISEYMPDGTVQDWLDQVGDIAPRAALAVADHVLFALEYAHSKGIIHRDIKPDNIFIQRQRGAFVLGDFGIMHTDTGGAPLTLPKKMLGSPDYIAPEQATGKLIDPRADLYAVGCLLYRLVYGDVPFHGTPLEVARAHVKAPLTLPDVPGVPFALRNIIRKAMEKQPDNRFPDAATMRAALYAVREVV